VKYDVAVIGAGIVGLASASAVTKRFPGVSVVVVDKEPTIGFHQTGHNSGVLHSGLYYKPGSLKADLCVRGQRAMVEFCEAEGLPFKRSGKLVVATDLSQIPAMEQLLARGTANGLQGLRRIDPDEIKEYEPHCGGVAALHVPESGVADYQAVAVRLAEKLSGDIKLGQPVARIRSGTSGVEIDTPGGTIEARTMIACAGLHADRVAAMSGLDTPGRVVPFRGEYYQLTEAASSLINGLIYPVPDPRFPWLGVHFTRRVDGRVEVGPNAVLAMGREHYRGVRPEFGELARTLVYGGFMKLAAKYWKTGAMEVWRSARSSTYAKTATKLVPEIRGEHLEPGGAGVRAQIVMPDGSLQDDFSMIQTDNAIHVLNAPSPAATSSLAIGDHIASLMTGML
jgi:L-2-hydroxyglutarate oxidase LhgO